MTSRQRRGIRQRKATRDVQRQLARIVARVREAQSAGRALTMITLRPVAPSEPTHEQWLAYLARRNKGA